MLLTSFLTSLWRALATSPPEKVFNFDETNFTDDLGVKKCFVRRGARRVEMIREHSKTAISVMWCGSASGDMIPPWSCKRRSTSMKVGRREDHVGPSTTARLDREDIHTFK